MSKVIVKPGNKENSLIYFFQCQRENTSQNVFKNYLEFENKTARNLQTTED